MHTNKYDITTNAKHSSLTPTVACHEPVSSYMPVMQARERRPGKYAYTPKLHKSLIAMLACQSGRRVRA